MEPFYKIIYNTEEVIKVTEYFEDGSVHLKECEKGTENVETRGKRYL